MVLPLGMGLPTFCVMGIFVGRVEYLSTKACAAARPLSVPPPPPLLDTEVAGALDPPAGVVDPPEPPLELHAVTNRANDASKAPTIDSRRRRDRT
jgi:hypothetical protein